MDPTSLTHSQLDQAIETLDERSRQEWIRARRPLIQEREERRRRQLGADIALALTQVADAWQAERDRIGQAPDNYPPIRQTDPPALSPRIASSLYERHESVDPEDLEEPYERYTHAVLDLKCGPGKHFVLIESFYRFEDGKPVHVDSDYGVWFGSGGDETCCEQLRQLAADTAEGLWTPSDDQRPRLDEQGRERFDYRGATRIYDEDGRAVPLTVLDHLTGGQK
jgi:hypothetical protein